MQTVGVFVNEEQSFDGYTLIFPSTSRMTYLIDNCGYVVNQWESEYTPGLVAYLQEDGSLIRTGRVFSSFPAGGNGGIIEKYSWDNTLLWQYRFANDLHQQHHDIAILANENILILAWEKVSTAFAEALGRDPSSIGPAGVWYEKVVEVEPIGSDSARIVWEWRLVDHLIQDRDSSLVGFGNIADHPERLDINYSIFSGNNPGSPDWAHFNAIDYNPQLDQIILNSRTFDEFYIIDHSTTTAEATGSTGGNSGMGGDFLYRYGNPQVYDRGGEENRVFYGQHDAHWIPEGMPDAGKIMVFNNGEGRPDGNYSSIEIIAPPMDSNGNYIIDPGQAYGPDSLYYSFSGADETAFYSRRVSGVQQMPNGNLLICDGNAFRIFEVTQDGQLVWDYINPVNNNGPVMQGQTGFNRDLFRAYRYAIDYGTLALLDIESGNKLELNPIVDDCELYREITGVTIVDNPTFAVYPNPSRDIIYLPVGNQVYMDLNIYSVEGQLVKSIPYLNDQIVDVSDLGTGIYLGTVADRLTGQNFRFRFIKN